MQTASGEAAWIRSTVSELGFPRGQSAVQADDSAHRVTGGFQFVGIVNDSI